MQESRIIRTKDGREICATFYLSGESQGKVIIIGPAAEVTQRFYRPLAVLFRQLTYDVVTFDYRGVGNSAPSILKGFNADLHQWAVQDADAIIRNVKNSFPGKEIVYIGHGISGEIIGLAQASQYINKLVLVSSSLSCSKLFPFKDRVRVGVMKALARVLNKVYGYFPGSRLGYLRDLPKDVVYEWANWCNSPNGLFDSYPDNNYRKLQIPILVFSFSDDWRCPQRAVKELLDHFCCASITWHHMKPDDLYVNEIGHTGFFEPEMKGGLWVMLDQWLNNESNFKFKPREMGFRPA